MPHYTYYTIVLHILYYTTILLHIYYTILHTLPYAPLNALYYYIYTILYYTR